MLASEGFVIAHGLEPGDRVPAVINGRLRRLTIVGVALSPEFIYSIRPGELVPDDRRYGIFWMDQQALAAAFDMEGGFNDVVARPVARRVGRRTSSPGSIASSSRTAGSAPIPRALQLSHWTVENELAQLQSFGFMLPLIFLMVAAFILNVALTRALALQRPQIAALKALGYGNRAIGWHYLKWALAIGAGRRRPRASRGGAWLGTHAHRAVQRSSSAFPKLLFSVPPRVIVGATIADAGAPPAPARSARCAAPCACRRPRRCGRRRRRAIAAACSRRRSSPATWATPDAWCCATSPAIRCARRPRCSASASPWRSS